MFFNLEVQIILMASDCSILGILTGSNPVHMKYFDAIGAEKFKIKSHIQKSQNSLFKAFNLFASSLSVPSSYGCVITESCYYYPALKKKLGLLKSRIINMNTSPVLYNLLSGRFTGYMRSTLLDLLEPVDAFLVQGDYGIEVLKRMKINKPFRVFYPYISKEKYKTMKTVNPALKTKNITIIVTGDYYCKGLDLLMDAFEIVNEKFPDAKLNVIGDIPFPENYAKLQEKTKNNIVKYENLHDISSVLKKTSLYVHPGRGETFGVSILEAMLAGVPSLVSNETGAKEAVRKVRKDFVLPLDSGKIAGKITEYFELKESEKKELSKKSRKEASGFREKILAELFRRKFQSLLYELYD